MLSQVKHFQARAVSSVHLGIAPFGPLPPVLPIQSNKIIDPFSEDADFYDIRELVPDKSKWQHQYCLLLRCQLRVAKFSVIRRLIFQTKIPSRFSHSLFSEPS